jgi:hypothetical protein
MAIVKHVVLTSPQGDSALDHRLTGADHPAEIDVQHHGAVLGLADMF